MFQKFSDVSRGYRNGTIAWNVSKKCPIEFSDITKFTTVNDKNYEISKTIDVYNVYTLLMILNKYKQSN